MTEVIDTSSGTDSGGDNVYTVDPNPFQAAIDAREALGYHKPRQQAAHANLELQRSKADQRLNEGLKALALRHGEETRQLESRHAEVEAGATDNLAQSLQKVEAEYRRQVARVNGEHQAELTRIQGLKEQSVSALTQRHMGQNRDLENKVFEPVRQQEAQAAELDREIDNWQKVLNEAEKEIARFSTASQTPAEGTEASSVKAEKPVQSPAETVAWAIGMPTGMPEGPAKNVRFTVPGPMKAPGSVKPMSQSQPVSTGLDSRSARRTPPGKTGHRAVDVRSRTSRRKSGKGKQLLIASIVLLAILAIAFRSALFGGSDSPSKSNGLFPTAAAAAAVKNCTLGQTGSTYNGDWMPAPIKAWEKECVQATQDSRIVSHGVNTFDATNHNQKILYAMMLLSSGGNDQFGNAAAKGLLPARSAVGAPTAKEMNIKFDPLNKKNGAETSLLVAMRRFNDVTYQVLSKNPKISGTDYVNALLTDWYGSAGVDAKGLKKLNALLADWGKKTSQTAADDIAAKKPVLTAACAQVLNEHRLSECQID